MKNPLVTGIISVTKVDTTPDLDYCKVYVSIFPDNNKKEVFEQIQHSAGFIRHTLCEKIDLRKVPYLTFYLDDTLEYGKNIDEKIEQIENSRKETKDENK